MSGNASQIYFIVSQWNTTLGKTLLGLNLLHLLENASRTITGSPDCVDEYLNTSIMSYLRVRISRGSDVQVFKQKQIEHGINC